MDSREREDLARFILNDKAATEAWAALSRDAQHLYAYSLLVCDEGGHLPKTAIEPENIDTNLWSMAGLLVDQAGER